MVMSSEVVLSSKVHFSTTNRAYPLNQTPSTLLYLDTSCGREQCNHKFPVEVTWQFPLVVHSPTFLYYEGKFLLMATNIYIVVADKTDGFNRLLADVYIVLGKSNVFFTNI